MRSGDEPKRKRLVAAHVAVKTGFELRRRNFVTDLKSLGGFAVGIARFHGELVGFDEQRLLGKFVFDPADGRVHGTVVKPVAHAQSKEILGTADGFGVKTEMVEGDFRQPFEFDGEKTEPIERMIF